MVRNTHRIDIVEHGAQRVVCCLQPAPIEDVMQKRGPFKSQALEVLKRRNVPIGTILDVGVLSETYDLRIAFPKLKHVLFEPVEEFNAVINQHYRGMDIEIHNCAVSSDTGEARLQTWSLFDNLPISHSTMVAEDAQGGTYRRVPMTSLDAFMSTRTYAEPFLLKIDIDGREMSVLEGAGTVLPRCTVVIVEAAHETLVDRIGFLVKAGFRLFDLVEPCYYDDCFWQCDLVMVRKDIWRDCLGQTDQVTDPRKYTVFQ